MSCNRQPARCLNRPGEKRRTGAQQLRAAFAGADSIGVEVEPIAQVKVAAAWVGRIRLIADVGLAGCRGRRLARRRGVDRVIACRALIAPILAPRVAGCTRRRRWSGSNLRTAPNRARCRRRVCVRGIHVAYYKIAQESIRPCGLGRMRRLPWLRLCSNMQRHATRPAVAGSEYRRG